MLPKERPETGHWDNSLAFEYHYEVLPSSIISKFIVGMNTSLSQGTYSHIGVVLEYEGGRNRALVRADKEGKKVFIDVDGNEATRGTFLGVIRSDPQRIHQTIPSLAVGQKVPVPGHPGVVVDYDHLLTLEGLREETFVPEGMRESVNVKRLLDGVEPEEDRWRRRRSGDSDLHRGSTNIVHGNQYVANEMSFNQVWNQVENSIDLPALAEELTKVQQRMLTDDSESNDPAAMGNVMLAQKAALDGDGPGALKHLKSAGKWALDVGTEIGAKVAVEAAKAGLGI